MIAFLRDRLQDTSLCAFVCMTIFANSNASGQSRTPLDSDKSPSENYLVGTATCASTACHARIDPLSTSISTLGREYSTWHEKDPHFQKSRLTLTSDNFDAIIRKVSEIQHQTDTAPVRQSCLPCHSPMSDARAYEPAIGSQRELEPGIGCESCHGEASSWLNRHYESGISESQLVALSMKPLTRLQTRASACAECHVGSATASVTHDMYAAGHPPMRFEFASYHTRLPKHWRSADERRRIPEFESELWIAGQKSGISAELAEWLGSLQKRPASITSQAASTKYPSPRDLAKFDCYSCHRTISLSPESRPSARLSSVPHFRTWNSAFLFDGLGPAALQTSKSQVLEILAGQTTGAEPAAYNALKQFAQQAIVLPATSDHPSPMPRTALILSCLEQMLSRIESQQSELSWDDACQIYLALRAIERSLSPAEDKVVSQKLNAIRDLLRFTDEDRERPRLWQTPGTADATIKSLAHECIDHYRSGLDAVGEFK